jgi:hypothetical protein
LTLVLASAVPWSQATGSVTGQLYNRNGVNINLERLSPPDAVKKRDPSFFAEAATTRRRESTPPQNRHEPPQ